MEAAQVRPNYHQSISMQWLLCIQSLIFVGLILLFYDKNFNSSYWTTLLPRTPTELVWFNIIFFLPHVFFSHLIVCFDTGYFSAFKKTYLKCLALSAGLVLVLSPLIGERLFLWFFLAVTHDHLVQQQIGISKVGLKRPGKTFLVFRWVNTLAVYLGTWIYFFDLNLSNFFLGSFGGYTLGLGFLILLFVLTFKISFRAKNKITFVYNWAYLFMPISLVIFGYYEWTAVWVFLSRVIHDMTAWCIYIVHQRNRTKDGLGIPLLKKVSQGPFLSWIFLPAIGILVALPFSLYQRENVFKIIVPIVLLLHYFTEHWLWKKTQPTRKYVSFKF